MISLQTNIDSLVAQQNLNTNSMFQSNTIQQLTSGYRINSSADDAAGLAVANTDRDQIAQITQGVANGNNSTAQLQIMDGGMSNISQILDRLQTLATEAASSSSTTSTRASLNQEFQTDITELNRQAQAIGLNTGGTYATTMDVYLGGGAGSTSAAASADGQVQVNLSKSAVDAQALGLTGMQVVAGTADISTGSATHSVNQIVTNNANATATPGTTVFYLSGPGFSDNSKVALSVSLAGVSDTNTLVTAINNAITNAAGGTSPADQALKGANITASVNTDANGGQELSFSSSTSAFQVEAGDQMANALMGNLSSGSTGTAISTTVTGGDTLTSATSFTPTTGAAKVQISGAGLASPVTITLNSSADTTVGAAILDLQNQVQQSAVLQAAGITISGSALGPLTFTSATGQSFSVQSTGDTQNALGLGALTTSSPLSPAFYSTISTSAAPSTTITSSGLATLGFSLNGGATGGAGPTIAGSALASSTVNTGAFAGTALKLTINGGAQISVNFANDAHAGSAESLANVASYINSTVDAAMGWSSGVQLASVNAAGNGLNLTDTIANSSSVMTVTANATSAALGLTANSSTNNTATAPQAAAITGTAPGTASVNTNAAPTLALNVNGTAVSVNFGNDANKSATESWQNVVNYINSQVDAQMGWGSDVKLAQITPSTSGATSSITLTDPYADSNSTVTVTTGSALLGLATNQTATGTGPVGNTVTLNLAGGNATAATVTGGNTVGPNVNTATGSLTFSIDGTTVNAALTNAGATAAAVTGSSFGSDGTALVNTGSLLTASTYLDTADSLPSDTGIDLTGMNALTINGAVIDISGQAAAGTLQGIVQAINGTAADTFTAGGAVTAKEVTTAGGNYAIQLTSAATGTGAGIAITNNASSQAAGLTNSGQAGTVHGTAGTSNLLKLDINGLGAVSVNFTGDANIQPDGTETLANAASTINAAIDAQYDTETTYVSGASGALVITSPTQGSSSLVSVTSTGGFAAAAQLFGVAGASGSATGKDQTLGSVVASLNTQAQQQMGTATTANIFSLNASNQIVIDSQTKGATSNVALTAVTSTSGTLASDLGLTTLLGDAAAGVSGTGPTTSSIANMLQQAFNNPSNSTLQKAGLQASGVDGGALTISSSNGTNFRIDEYGSVGANLGFGISGGSFTGLTSGASGASMIDAGGTSALGTGTVQNPYLSFAPMKFGSDTQAITISANSAAGVSQPPVTITLQNNGTAQTGATIDSAVSYINSQLRQSNNPTMQSIVAVEENVGGTEQINFLSSSPSFSVSVGNSVNGDGLNAGTAKTFNSVTNGSAGTASIDTLAGAQAAVTAVSAAVAQLGTAQAAVGIGENQVNYAVNLAQSQITNISSAESQIRDANVAQQAANMTKASVLQQATIAAMAQANQEPQAVLSLLKQ